MNSQRSVNAAPRVALAAGASGLAIYGTAAFAVTLWGGTAVVTKIAVGGLDPLLVGVLRSAFAGLALVPVVLVARIRRPATLRELFLLLASAITGFVIFPILFAFGLRHTTASHTGLIMAAQPIFTGSVAALVEWRSPGLRWALGCALALVGEVVLIGFRLGLDDSGTFLGDFLILASGFSASAGYVFGSRLSRSIGTWATTLWGNLLAGIIMLGPLAYWGSDYAWGTVGTRVWVSLAYLALCSSIIAYVAWYWALTKGGIARIGAAQFATPVVTVVFAVLILGETITLPLVLAACVILAGIWLAQRR